MAHHPDLDQLRQRIIASHHLEALDAAEVERYISHRLQHVGWEGNPVLGEGLLSALFEATNGIPRRVNQVMNRLLLLGAIEEHSELSLKMLEAVCEEMAADQTRGARKDAGAFSLVKANDAQTVQPQISASNAPNEERTAQLEAAIAELQAVSAQTVDPEVGEALERLEARLEEQERSFRHVLTMLIEWLEDGNSREAA